MDETEEVSIALKLLNKRIRATARARNQQLDIVRNALPHKDWMEAEEHLLIARRHGAAHGALMDYRDELTVLQAAERWRSGRCAERKD